MWNDSLRQFCLLSNEWKQYRLTWGCSLVFLFRRTYLWYLYVMVRKALHGAIGMGSGDKLREYIACSEGSWRTEQWVRDYLKRQVTRSDVVRWHFLARHAFGHPSPLPWASLGRRRGLLLGVRSVRERWRCEYLRCFVLPWPLPSFISWAPRGRREMVLHYIALHVNQATQLRRPSRLGA